MKLFSIFDLKSISYGPIFECGSKEEAVRMLVSSCSSQESNLSKYPEDYCLSEVGYFDRDTGVVSMETPPVHLITALEALANYKEMLRRVERRLDVNRDENSSCVEASEPVGANC